jgi:hypothetical protein
MSACRMVALSPRSAVLQRHHIRCCLTTVFIHVHDLRQPHTHNSFHITHTPGRTATSGAQ